MSALRKAGLEIRVCFRKLFPLTSLPRRFATFCRRKPALSCGLVLVGIVFGAMAGGLTMRQFGNGGGWFVGSLAGMVGGITGVLLGAISSEASER
jgi:uncharacterized protein YcfJ